MSCTPLIPVAQRANVPTPPADQVYLFLDSDANNALTYRRDDGLFFVLSAGTASAGQPGCECDLAEELAEAVSCGLKNGTVTAADAVTLLAAIKFYTVTTVDPNTGSFTSSLSTTRPLFASVATTDESAPGANDGTATATVSGGKAPYVLTWGPGVVNPAALPDGNYTLTVVDANAEAFLVTFTIN